jgi:DNA repair protein RecO
MSHHLYQTEGIVVGGFNVGESNRFLYLFTRELGLLGASAQGVRELKSKLRYSLQDFSYSNINLVRGKEVWRVTNAEKINLLENIIKNKEKQKIFTNLCLLIRRLFVGEGGHEQLFDDIVSGLRFLETRELSREDLKNLEIILVLKILYNLGYWGEEDKFAVFLENRKLDKQILDEMVPLRVVALSHINNALRDSHL